MLPEELEMNRFAVILFSFVFSISLPVQSNSPQEATEFVFKGKLTTREGRAVVGAEVRIVDASGRTKNRVLSDLAGSYRIPVIHISPDEVKSYGMQIDHPLFEPVRISAVTDGAILLTPALTKLTPGEALPLFSLTQTVLRDLILSPSGSAAEIDLNYMEYQYRESLLLLSENRPKQAQELLKRYAQVGGNPEQVKRALELFTELDKQQEPNR